MPGSFQSKNADKKAHTLTHMGHIHVELEPAWGSATENSLSHGVKPPVSRLGQFSL